MRNESEFSSASRPTVPSAAPAVNVIETVARAIYDSNTPAKHAVEFDGLQPLAQKRYRRRARAAYEALNPASWQPIETAPMDGRAILLGNSTHVSSGHYWQNANRKHPRDRWVWDGWPQGEPTHWMPLPEPPKEVA